jgi:4,5-dihydroxyphthalate decarboxylase
VTKLTVSLTAGPYDRTRALFDGRVEIEGCNVVASPLEPEEIFFRAYRYQDFDITELSLSTHLLTTARGDSPFIGIPAFLSRVFRHSGIYIRTDRGIKSPADLRGKTIGLPEYQQTANVWIRGMLQDDYGVRATDIKWRSGGMEQPGRTERTPITLAPEFDVKPIPSDATLSKLLEAGELDGIIGPRAPSCFERGTANIARLFPDYRQAEEAYFSKSKMFPIMHIVGIRRELVERHPWLPANVFKAFVKAKDIAVAELGQIGRLSVSLPWLVPEVSAAKKLMGDDYWSYGAAKNQADLDAITRYMVEQGLAKRKLALDEIFAKSTLDSAKF